VSPNPGEPKPAVRRRGFSFVVSHQQASVTFFMMVKRRVLHESWTNERLSSTFYTFGKMSPSKKRDSDYSSDDSDG
jgi:hypothetical protein